MGVENFITRPLAAAVSSSDLVNPAKWLTDGFAGRPVSSGVRVTPASALNLGTYFACVRNVAEDTGKHRWEVERVDGYSRTAVHDHPLSRLIEDSPNPEMSSQAWREAMLAAALSQGNAYSEIERDSLGNVVALWPIPTELVTPWRDPTTRRLWYYVSPFHGFGGGLIWPQDVWHLHGLSLDGVIGLSIARLAANDVGNALAAQDFQGQIFAKGAVSRVVLEYGKKLDLRQIRTMRKQWLEHYGSPENMTYPLILEGGMTAKAIQISPADVQFIESVKEGVYGIARWFRMPPHKLGALDKATMNNIEHLEIEYLVDTLLAWATRVETETNRKCLPPAQRAAGYRTMLDLDTGLRADFKTRTEGKKNLVQGGIFTPNEARRGESVNPYPGEAGDKLWMQSAMAPIDKLLEGPKPPQLPPGPTSGPTPPAQPPPVDGSGGDATGDGAVGAVHERARRGAAAALLTLRDSGTRAAARQEKALARLAQQHAVDADGFDRAAAAYFANEREMLAEIVTPAARGFLAIREALDLSSLPAAAIEDLVAEFSKDCCAAGATAASRRFRSGARAARFDAKAEGEQIALGLLATIGRELAKP